MLILGGKLEDNTVWFEMLYVIEIAIGLIAGSLPPLGKMFHLYDKPAAGYGGLSRTLEHTANNTLVGTARRMSSKTSKRTGPQLHPDGGSDVVLRSVGPTRNRLSGFQRHQVRGGVGSAIWNQATNRVLGLGRRRQGNGCGGELLESGGSHIKAAGFLALQVPG